MIYSVVVFTVFVYSFGIKNYLKDSNVKLIFKIIHLLIAFIVFQHYFISFRVQLWDFFRNGEEAFYSSESFKYFSRTFDVISELLFFFTSLYTAGLFLNIAVKAKSRKLLLITSPFIALFSSLDIFKTVLEEQNIGFDLILFLIIFINYIVVFGAINLYYNLNPGRRIFIRNRIFQ